MTIEERVTALERRLLDDHCVSCETCGRWLSLQGDGCLVAGQAYCWTCAPPGEDLEREKAQWGEVG